ncbi:YeiH family putative sulfate export transporter [Neisseria lisongii]|uniref:YeiH family putative sulfate export transporter n=1 Tax=Neisseria lisongii TaxID=2912188 RepID=A0AAW5AEG6_9NEIS|nr:YeiH family putative sulfate export transporter [Neisseria lisongii]MCF7529709.1 YeiH family putative sulfate export transporter [Neisseria lisongii]
MNRILGGVLVGVIAFLALQLSQTALAQQFHFSALTLAVVLGMVLGNTLYRKIENHVAAGIAFAKGKVLYLGIILYGFNITLQDIGAVGVNAVATDAVMLISTFLITCALGIYLLKIDKQIVYLAASGCSICGAAAVMAAAPVVKGESHKVAVAVALVVIFGTLSMFLYPVLYPYLHHYLSAHQFGIYAGSSIHEVAQVYAAGGNISPEVADTAVISKMIRVMMLAPFLVMLSWWLQKDQQGNQGKVAIPWFAVLFIMVALFNSLNLLPANWVKWFTQLDGILLMLAMSALGLTTQISAVRKAGIKPLLLGALVFVWLVAGGFVINWGMQSVFRL